MVWWVHCSEYIYDKREPVMRVIRIVRGSLGSGILLICPYLGRSVDMWYAYRPRGVKKGKRYLFETHSCISWWVDFISWRRGAPIWHKTSASAVNLVSCWIHPFWQGRMFNPRYDLTILRHQHWFLLYLEIAVWFDHCFDTIIFIEFLKESRFGIVMVYIYISPGTGYTEGKLYAKTLISGSSQFSRGKVKNSQSGWYIGVIYAMVD